MKNFENLKFNVFKKNKLQYSPEFFLLLNYSCKKITSIKPNILGGVFVMKLLATLSMANRPSLLVQKNEVIRH